MKDLPSITWKLLLTLNWGRTVLLQYNFVWLDVLLVVELNWNFYRLLDGVKGKSQSWTADFSSLIYFYNLYLTLMVNFYRVTKVNIICVCYSIFPSYIWNAILILFIYLFGHAVQLAGSQFPNEGSNPGHGQ